MECMEAKALKSSFVSEMAMKTNSQQSFSDDFWCFTGFPTSGEDFSIDEFFDLPNDENDAFLEMEEEEDEKYSSSLSLSSHDPVDFPSDFVIPVDDVQELELWSHLMDDSIPEATTILACPNPIIGVQHKKTGFNSLNRVEPVKKTGVGRVPFIPSAVPVKPRSKRPRVASDRCWYTASPPSSSSPSSSSSSSSPIYSSLGFPNRVHEMGMMLFPFGKPPLKKPKKKSALVGGAGGGIQVPRRCTHCQVTKTPQWRAGPTGPKTLCNACGVRFKSGRLFPEYRPACSPDFSIEIHSNSHRKVIEMRRKKEITGPVTGLTGC